MKYKILIVSLVAVLTVTAVFADTASDIVSQYQKQGETLSKNAQAAFTEANLAPEEKLYLAEMQLWGAACQYGADAQTFDKNIAAVLATVKNVTEAEHPYQNLAAYLLKRQLDALHRTKRTESVAEFLHFNQWFMQLINVPLPNDVYLNYLRTIETADMDNAKGLVTTIGEIVKPIFDKANLAEPLNNTLRRVNITGKEMLLDGTTTDGQFVSVKDFRNKIVLIAFQSARQAAANEKDNVSLKKLNGILPENDVVFLTYNTDLRSADARNRGITNTTICRLESSTDYQKIYQTESALFLVGKDGNVIKTWNGLCGAVCVELTKHLPDKQESLQKLAEEIDTVNSDTGQNSEKPVLSLLDKLQSVYGLLQHEESRAADILALTDAIETLDGLSLSERRYVAETRIKTLADVAFAQASEQPETHPVQYYEATFQAIEHAKVPLDNDIKPAIELSILRQMLVFLQHGEDKGGAVKDIQNRYTQFVISLETNNRPVAAAISASALVFATDFARTLRELPWDGAIVADIGFLEAVIPIFEKSSDVQWQQEAENLTKLKRRLFLSAKPFELECVLLDGTKLNVANLRGKVVLVDFWATWCPSCRGSFPNKVQQYEKYKDKGLEVIAYSVDTNVEALRKYQEQHKFAWKNGSLVLSTEQGLKDYEKFYGIWGIPTTYLLDRTGKVIFMQVESNNEKLNEALEKALGE